MSEDAILLDPNVLDKLDVNTAQQRTEIEDTELFDRIWELAINAGIGSDQVQVFMFFWESLDLDGNPDWSWLTTKLSVKSINTAKTKVADARRLIEPLIRP